MPTLDIALTGDSLITRPFGDFQARGYSELVALLRAADVGFTNLETVVQVPGAPSVRPFAGYPAVESGGTYTAAPSAVLDDLRGMGLHLLSTANNHAMDYSVGGLHATLRASFAAGLHVAGTGRDLATARAPACAETRAGRVALVAATSTFPASSRAGEQRRDMRGRPGVNPLRMCTEYVVPASMLDTIRTLDRQLGFAALREQAIADGWERPAPPGKVHALGYTFRQADDAASDGESEQDQSGVRIETFAHEGDLAGNLAAIREARRQADWVIVSLHCHEQKAQPEEPPDFLIAVAHAAIDAGADLVVGHGPHVLRGIEVYRSRPILYSLGNFIFQNETLPRLPQDMYDRYESELPEQPQSAPHDTTLATPADVFDARSDSGRRGFPSKPQCWETLAVRALLSPDALIRLALHPVTLGYGAPRPRRGRPVLATRTDAERILQRVQALSDPFGTSLDIEAHGDQLVGIIAGERAEPA